MENCLFCAIAEGKIPALKVFEDNQFYAVLDINPANPGHLIIVPKVHYKTVMEMPDTEYARFFLVARALTLAVLEYGALGANFIYSLNEAAGQRSPHLVLHVIPRYTDDKVSLVWQPQKMDENQLKQIQQKLIEKVQLVAPKLQQAQVQPSSTSAPVAPPKPKEPEKPTVLYKRAAGYW